MSYSQRRSFSVISLVFASATNTRSAYPHTNTRERVHTHTHTTYTHTYILSLTHTHTYIYTHTYRRFVCLFKWTILRAYYFFFFLFFKYSTASFFVKIGFLARFFLPSLMTHGSCLFIYTGRQAP